MVISAGRTSRRPPPPPPPHHSQLLHNFSFPILKTWGAQRLLRCANVNGKGETIASGRGVAGGDSVSRIGSPDDERDGDQDLEEMREKLMAHLREAADRMELPVGPAAGEPEATRPWSLRPRRSASRVSFETERDLSPSPPARPTRLRRRFAVTLSKEEIAEDIYAVTGSLPRRRPRKRARVVQKQLDALFPGGWLSEITVDSYKVRE